MMGLVLTFIVGASLGVALGFAWRYYVYKTVFDNGYRFGFDNGKREAYRDLWHKGDMVVSKRTQ